MSDMPRTKFAAKLRLRSQKEKIMLKDKIFDEIASKISDVIAASPAKDVEKNVRAMMTSAFTRLDLVTREEFEIQQDVLAKTREKLAEIENRLVALEKAAGPDNPQDAI
jgi:BMFP domain-containing protein YqiC